MLPVPGTAHHDGRAARRAAPAGQRRRNQRGVGASPQTSEGGEIVLRFQDAKRLHEDAIAIYRKKHALLSADEVRAIRERFDLTQADLARLLRLGANTVSRWESGRNVQTVAMDILLRLVRDIPGSIEYLPTSPLEEQPSLLYIARELQRTARPTTVRKDRATPQSVANSIPQLEHSSLSNRQILARWFFALICRIMRWKREAPICMQLLICSASGRSTVLCSLITTSLSASTRTRVKMSHENRCGVL